MAERGTTLPAGACADHDLPVERRGLTARDRGRRVRRQVRLFSERYAVTTLAYGEAPDGDKRKGKPAPRSAPSKTTRGASQSGQCAFEYPESRPTPPVASTVCAARSVSVRPVRR